MNQKILYFFTVLGFLSFGYASAQYPGGVGQPGTTAMYKDSSAFMAWAAGCTVKRGYQDISNPSLGKASAGDSSLALGKAQSNGVVSLGDGGYAICTFQSPIKNGYGPDFAVFENGFDDSFLELAVVEVSSDGVNFTRFKSHSLTDTTVQTGTFGSTDPTKVNNLAGKYRGGYGTPFDLQELAGTPGLDVNAITHVKVIDVVGSINKLYATYDGYGNKINDPWPTAFPSGGFDLDAIGVIDHNVITSLAKNKADISVKIFPNPLRSGEELHVESGYEVKNITLTDALGCIISESSNAPATLTAPAQGTYLLRITTGEITETRKIVVYQP